LVYQGSRRRGLLTAITLVVAATVAAPTSLGQSALLSSFTSPSFTSSLTSSLVSAGYLYASVSSTGGSVVSSSISSPSTGGTSNIAAAVAIPIALCFALGMILWAAWFVNRLPAFLTRRYPWLQRTRKGADQDLTAVSATSDSGPSKSALNKKWNTTEEEEEEEKEEDEKREEKIEELEQKKSVATGVSRTTSFTNVAQVPRNTRYFFNTRGKKSMGKEGGAAPVIGGVEDMEAAATEGGEMEASGVQRLALRNVNVVAEDSDEERM